MMYTVLLGKREGINLRLKERSNMVCATLDDAKAAALAYFEGQAAASGADALQLLENGKKPVWDYPPHA
jgi:hypothetical protein